ncbi:16S rRNA (adenine(1518)-N(6)/adenine(1519)-N(6))-dimethyltransferase RsmA [Acidihalobacter prosperus]|uniref:Ribosomal RNA small subunit methyltransferase A n=1 Tax=Acidihalobacter prosperus TaxID=160660 RepID=A0A1A6C6H8_9GAMM|nr:16S rRNA (adenine(1518)-N(6)/adenine(1519)-N(6))-dimethyltransferase RsmA [Acidihalobacter prosperus]OBS10145.1 16S rRNA (adenine(1518)-N(6)/adenine(1519)-N(6))- dimethyltransferase [Acidihalobacter prosperus]
MSHVPRKRFGQHFLHDHQVIERIAAAIAPRAEDALIEIGPGEGALTAALLARIDRLDAVELDRDLVPRLRTRFGGRLDVHEADALRFDFAALAPAQGLRIVGNLPYNISTPLIFHLLEAAPHIRDMTFLLQREVVQRLAATPGSKPYGRLSVMVQYRCRAESLFEVGPGAFTPPPKVDSALVRLTPWPAPPHPAQDPRLFARLVEQAFSQRRKTLGRALRGQVEAEDFAQAGIDPVRRAETLSVAEFVALANTARTRTAIGSPSS